jgi:hypothetical protein
MIRVNAVTGKPHEPLAFVFGNGAGKQIASPKKAWEVCVLKAHDIQPEWVRPGNKLSAACRERLAAINLHWHDLRHEAGSRWGLRQGGRFTTSSTRWGMRT